MAKKKKEKNNLIRMGIILIVVIIFLCILIISRHQTNLSNENIITPSPNAIKQYHSNLLDITINIPNDFTIKEVNALREIIFEKDGRTIRFHRYGTNRAYKNIKELLDEIYNLDAQAKEIKRQQIKINGMDCETSTVNYFNQPELNNKTYDCFINSNSFLSISTNSPELYSDLDQVVRSFRYAP